MPRSHGVAVFPVVHHAVGEDGAEDGPNDEVGDHPGWQAVGDAPDCLATERRDAVLCDMCIEG